MAKAVGATEDTVWGRAARPGGTDCVSPALLERNPPHHAGGNAYRIVIRFGGQYVIEAGPMKLARWTGPQSRESQEAARLSPMTKY
jgi:hypothetical protein